MYKDKTTKILKNNKSRIVELYFAETMMVALCFKKFRFISQLCFKPIIN